MNNFTSLELKCVEHYLTCRNKVESYKLAYGPYTESESAIRQQAFRLFRREHVQFMIRQIEADDLRKMKVDGNWVLRRASLLANFNINSFVIVDEDGKPYYDFSNATDDDWYCISELTVDQILKGRDGDKYEVDRVKLKPYDKLKALDLVGKHVEVQAFQENVHHTISTEDYKLARREMLELDDC